MLVLSTTTATPWFSKRWSSSLGASKARAYWKPEQPPPRTATRRACSPPFSCSPSNSLILPAALSVSVMGCGASVIENHCRGPSPRTWRLLGDTQCMGSDEVAVVRGAFEAMARSVDAPPEGRAELTERWFHPDVEYVEDASWPGASTYIGRDRVRKAFDGYNEILGAELSLEEVIEGSDGLFARVRYRGTSTGAEVPWDETWGYHCRVRDAQLSFFRAYSDLDAALAAAGVASP